MKRAPLNIPIYNRIRVNIRGIHILTHVHTNAYLLKYRYTFKSTKTHVLTLIDIQTFISTRDPGSYTLLRSNESTQLLVLTTSLKYIINSLNIRTLFFMLAAFL